MSWSKIKSAINSTIGTPSHAPLNSIIEKGFLEIKVHILGIKNSLSSGENEYTVKKSKFLSFSTVDVGGVPAVTVEKEGTYIFTLLIGNSYYSDVLLNVSDDGVTHTVGVEVGGGATIGGEFIYLSSNGKSVSVSNGVVAKIKKYIYLGGN